MKRKEYQVRVAVEMEKTVDTTLRILLIDDSPDDRLLVLRHLRQEFADLQVVQVSTPEGLAQALEEGSFDLVITDYQLHWADGLGVLRAVKARFPDYPVIMFTGTGNEEIAVEAIKSGLDDYIVKSPRHLFHLTAAVRQALVRAQERRAHAQVETRYRDLFNSVPVGILRSARDGRILDANPALVELFGFPDRESFLAADASPLYGSLLLERQLQSKRQDEIERFEAQVHRRGGEPMWVRVKLRVIRDAQGETSHFEGVVEDITAAREAEKALHDAARQWRTTFDAISDPVLLVDMEYRIVRCNKALAKLVDRPFNQIIGQQCCKIIRDQTAPLAECPVACLSEHPVRQTTAMLCRGRWFHVVVDPYLDDEGRLVGAVHTMIDVTEQRQTEAQLRAAEARYRSLVEQIPVVVYASSLSENLPVLYISPRVEAMLGFAPADFCSDPGFWNRQIHPADRERVVAQVARTLATGAPFVSDYRFLVAEGRVVWCHDESAVIREPDGTPLFLQGILQDITAHKEAEDEILRRTAYREALSAIITAAIAAPDLPALLQAVLDYVLEAMGLEKGRIWTNDHSAVRGVPQEIVQLERKLSRLRQETGNLSVHRAIEDWRQLPLEDPLAAHAAMLARIDVAATLFVPIEVAGERIGGIAVGAAEARTWSAEEIALLDAVSKQLGVVVERLDLLERLQEQARRVSKIIDAVPDGVVLLDAGWRVQVVNPAARELLTELGGVGIGDRLEQLGGRPIELLLAPPDVGRWHEVQVAGPPRLVLEVSARALLSRDEGSVMVIRNVTEERSALERAQQQDRLAVVGQLAAGIAHDFNNTLQTIILMTQLLQRRADTPTSAQDPLALMFQQEQRAAQLIRQILDFTRQSIVQQNPVELKTFFAEVVGLLRRTLADNIEVKVDLPASDCCIHGDPGQLEQVLVNLALNARDAMPRGGMLRLSLAPLRLAPDAVPPVVGMPAGEWAVFTVSDTGAGMSPGVLGHLFEPFFTTKGPGLGVGLGLSQAYGIVRQHDGWIDVHSRVNQGTTFTIYLPALGETGRAGAGEGEEVIPRGAGQTILLVEDDPAVRDADSKALEELGYRVLPATSGRQALELFDRHRAQVALVLTDVVMPGMGGAELFNALRARDPAAKVLLVSGYPLGEPDSVLSVSGWLQKPLTMAQLARAVEQALR